MSKVTIEDKLKDLGPAELAETRRLVAEVVRLREAQARMDGEVASCVARLAEIAQAQGEAMGSSHGPEYARRAMAAEVAAATRVHPGSARAELESAERLVTSFPVTHAALSEGRITAKHAKAVTDAGLTLDEGARASLDGLAVSFAETLTPGQFAKVVKLQAARVSAVTPAERHEAARAERGVFLTDLDDGMSELAVRVPTLHAHGIHDRLTRMARRVDDERRAARRAWVAAGFARPEAGWEHLLDEATPAMLAAAARATVDDRDGFADGTSGVRAGAWTSTVGTGRQSASASASTSDRIFAGTGEELGLRASDTRTFDQLRADLAADLALTGSPSAGHEFGATALAGLLSGVTAHVQVVIPARTIINPSEGIVLDARGTIIATDDALAAAGHATGWDRLFAAAETGELLAVDRYRPSNAQRRMIVARDATCRVMGCTVPARNCDIDHVHDYALGGTTQVGNLEALCERHHIMKHTSGWRVRALGGGQLEWTSPTGRTYPTGPESRVYFRELLTDDSPAPFEPPTTGTGTSASMPAARVEGTSASMPAAPAEKNTASSPAASAEKAAASRSAARDRFEATALPRLDAARVRRADAAARTLPRAPTSAPAPPTRANDSQTNTSQNARSKHQATRSATGASPSSSTKPSPPRPPRRPRSNASWARTSNRRPRRTAHPRPRVPSTSHRRWRSTTPAGTRNRRSSGGRPGPARVLARGSYSAGTISQKAM
ncbi:HNH endonuclease signature motif containing protein [Microbacterium halophytorum]|uniref:HNH endonuclease signature motif containing protein n=1 Tax=Microbacterium halophytorum TaxID=2067568 RepID=UPI000CFAE575|nr:HNH endonuclease signature motif containing protein [Microbacterium halophytorum]